MSKQPLERWERAFRIAARADDCALFREHLERLSPWEHLVRPVRPDEPWLMLDATIRLVWMCSVYAAIDGRTKDFGRFLKMQKYNPAEATDARYVFTFDLCGQAFARVLVDEKVRTLDLADLYGNPWWDLKVVGFHHIWISHPDWSNLTNEERGKIEDEVTSDLRFDYPEDELDFWFDDSLDESYQFVTVQDACDMEDDSDD